MAEGETVLAVRVAALERGQGQLFDAVRDLRQDVRALDGKVDRLGERVDQRLDRLDTKIDRIGSSSQAMMWAVLAGVLVTILIQLLHL